MSIVALFNDQKGKIHYHKWPSSLIRTFEKIRSRKNFKGNSGEIFFFNLPSGMRVLVLGLGDRKKYSREEMRREVAKTFKAVCGQVKHLSLEVETFSLEQELIQTASCLAESLGMASYSFDKYKKEPTLPMACKKIELVLGKSTKLAPFSAQLNRTKKIVESIAFGRNLVNEPPNILNSEKYGKIIQEDGSKLNGVKVRVLGKNEIKREKMGMFLSVNAGSAYEPRLVHLTYTPAKVGKNTKHIALVGKGLTFDTGGYSLKPSGSMVNMKYDMAGSATVYAAFRAMALIGANVKLSCFLGITDNAVSAKATMPDSIVSARNGKQVEILNTDAEGRLVLGDVLSYACEQRPHAIIDAATLTGAVLVALGKEVCAVSGNNPDLIKALRQSAMDSDEYLWELPIIKEFFKDLKTPNADIKNIPGDRYGGSAKAATFLQHFVPDEIPWAHLDIAGVAFGQDHLPYCPPKEASGLMVRTLVNFISNY